MRALKFSGLQNIFDDKFKEKYVWIVYTSIHLTLY